MRKQILLAAILIVAIFLSGCVSEPVSVELVYKFVCSDGTVADNKAACPIEGDIDYEEVCTDYCANIEDTSEEGLAEKVLVEMERANYCDVKEDCVETNTKCPLGCYHLVNVAELEKVNGFVKEFKQNCFQTCAALEDYECIDSKCEPTLPGVG